ncbi:MAG: exodeoxyribonuclease VII small subunit [Eubacteriales bacterium]|nr:exodeoxyribonuclease VII small subunit [Eubacteriales bacterium]MDD3882232.1 exodeoxyribonuclease VII small subunit [Eubacteriales bacterium]MDD4512581.1 exodeoxyribonuclease VII small subunit [Eubacteriales bacterium]
MAAKKPGFEEGLEMLSGLVETMEKGELSLEDTLIYYEKGVKLEKQLNEMLESGKRRIEILRSENGKNEIESAEAEDERE